MLKLSASEFLEIHKTFFFLFDTYQYIASMFMNVYESILATVVKSVTLNILSVDAE